MKTLLQQAECRIRITFGKTLQVSRKAERNSVHAFCCLSPFSHDLLSALSATFHPRGFSLMARHAKSGKVVVL
ncbi:MAG TPA: hypothetical protein PK871_09180, partial [Mycobacterium sp.]|nr:hypothetical protein [Mycobacterium sp.]